VYVPADGWLGAAVAAVPKVNLLSFSRFKEEKKFIKIKLKSTAVTAATAAQKPETKSEGERRAEQELPKMLP
jgi:hypothetical protein